MELSEAPIVRAAAADEMNPARREDQDRLVDRCDAHHLIWESEEKRVEIGPLDPELGHEQLGRLDATAVGKPRGPDPTERRTDEVRGRRRIVTEHTAQRVEPRLVLERLE